MTSRTATVLLVFGRGVRRIGEGYELTPAGAARVRAAVDYVTAHRASYLRAAADGPLPRIVFTGGWAEASEAAEQPPDGNREADLMLRQAHAAGLHRYAELRVETRSRSTLENLVHTVEDGLLDGHALGASRPLGIVSHAEHLPRVRFLAGLVLGLRGDALLDVPAAGGEAPARWRSQRAVHAATRLCFLGARDPISLMRRERAVVAWLRRAEQVANRTRRTWYGWVQKGHDDRPGPGVPAREPSAHTSHRSA